MAANRVTCLGYCARLFWPFLRRILPARGCLHKRVRYPKLLSVLAGHSIIYSGSFPFTQLTSQGHMIQHRSTFMAQQTLNDVALRLRTALWAVHNIKLSFGLLYNLKEYLQKVHQQWWMTIRIIQLNWSDNCYYYYNYYNCYTTTWL